MTPPGRADPRPPRRHVDREAGIAKCVLEGRCRICGEWYSITRHHLVPRSRGGDDRDENLVPLCGSGTTGCHGLIENLDPATRRALRRVLRPEEVAYVDRKIGRWWLDARYPL